MASSRIQESSTNTSKKQQNMHIWHFLLNIGNLTFLDISGYFDKIHILYKYWNLDRFGQICIFIKYWKMNRLTRICRNEAKQG